MQITVNDTARAEEIATLFRDTFTASEGADEGALVGKLAAELLATVAPPDLWLFAAIEADKIIGAIILTRLRYDADPRCVFLLSPVAVAPAHQRSGVGQGLLAAGFDHLAAQGIDVVMTYGDIRYYARAGFAQVSPDIARPPCPLSYPEGWLGRSLTGAPLTALKGPSVCVTAFDDPAYW